MCVEVCKCTTHCEVASLLTLLCYRLYSSELIAATQVNNKVTIYNKILYTLTATAEELSGLPFTRVLANNIHTLSDRFGPVHDE